MPTVLVEDQQATPEILFFDNFASSDLDRSKWNVRITGKVYNHEQQAYIDSSETVYILPADQVPGASQGALVIHPRFRPGFMTPEKKSFDFISGRIDTREKFDCRYGSASARIKLPSGIGLWPAFWMLGYGAWPESGEIDILEYVGEPDWVSAAAHGPGYFGEAGLVNMKYFTNADVATAWHVYSVDWHTDQLLFKVDGRTIYRATRPMVEFFGPWAFDNNKYLILNFALGGSYPFKTNGIQAPYHGLPEQTVKMIKDDQIRLLVDWIKVSRGS